MKKESSDILSCFKAPLRLKNPHKNHNFTASPVAQLTMADDVEAELVAAGKELDKVGLNLRPLHYH